jgi:hypothetical protein
MSQVTIFFTPMKSFYSTIDETVPGHLKAECATEEAALRLATAQDRAKIADFEKRADAIICGLHAVQKAAEKFIFERHRTAGKQKQHNRVNRTVRAAERVLVPR